MIYALLMFFIYLFILAIKLNTLRFKSVLLGTLLIKSLRVIQLPTHLSSLTTNG